MPEVIDVLTIPLSNCHYFDADNTVDSVTSVLPVTNRYCFNANGNDEIVKGDSIRVLSCGLIIPESFTLFKAVGGAPLPSIAVIPIGKVTGQAYSNPNFQNGMQYLPMENFETVTDSFLSASEAVNVIDPTKTLLYENYYLKLSGAFYTPVISMLNAPNSVNGKRFYVVPFIKIAHSLPMV